MKRAVAKTKLLTENVGKFQGSVNSVYIDLFKDVPTSDDAELFSAVLACVRHYSMRGRLDDFLAALHCVVRASDCNGWTSDALPERFVVPTGNIALLWSYCLGSYSHVNNLERVSNALRSAVLCLHGSPTGDDSTKNAWTIENVEQSCFVHNILS